jgi:anti-sigma regulatory factor (Ser/Thr protein kinase)
VTVVRVRLTGDRSPSPCVAALVDRLAGESGLPDRQAYRLRLATDELATNVAEHGYHWAPLPLDLIGGYDADRVWLRIEDSAPPFDPRLHATRPAPPEEDPAERAPGGYGLLLALRSVDSYEYEYRDGRNLSTVAMTWRPHRPGSA